MVWFLDRRAELGCWDQDTSWLTLLLVSRTTKSIGTELKGMRLEMDASSSQSTREWFQKEFKSNVALAAGSVR